MGPDPLAQLIALEPRDLSSLLLHVSAERAGTRTPRELLEQRVRTLACHPSFADPRLSTQLTADAFAAASAFEAVELAPVCPLGTTHALSGISQNNVFSATRNAELLADPTTALALELALRRQAPSERARPTRLCASQRVIRMQPAPPGLLPHFRLFALATGARRGRELLDELCTHTRVHLELLARLPARGFRLADVTVEIADTEVIAAQLTASGVDAGEIRRVVRTQPFADADALLARFGLPALRGDAGELLERMALERRLKEHVLALQDRVVAPLRAEFPSVRVRLDLSRLEGLGYYVGPALRISARDPAGVMLPLSDGGLLRWTEALLSDGRERLLTTGMGTDLLCARFR